MRRQLGSLIPPVIVTAAMLASGCGALDQDSCLDRGHVWDRVAERCIPDRDVGTVNVCRGSGGAWDYERRSCRRSVRPRSAATSYLARANRVCAGWNPRLHKADRSDHRYHALLRRAFADVRAVEPPPGQGAALRRILVEKRDALDRMPDDIRLTLRVSVRKFTSPAITRMNAANRRLASYGLTACADTPV